MNAIFSILGVLGITTMLIVSIMAVIGLINPQWVLRKRLLPTRWDVIKICGISMIISLIVTVVCAVSLPEVEKEELVKTTVTNDSIIKQESKPEVNSSPQKQSNTKSDKKKDFGCTVVEFLDKRFNKVTDRETPFLYMPEFTYDTGWGEKPFIYVPYYDVVLFPKPVSKDKYLFRYEVSVGSLPSMNININIYGAGNESKQKAKVYKIESVFDIDALELAFQERYGNPEVLITDDSFRVISYVLSIEGIIGSADPILTNDERVDIFNELGGKEIIAFSSILADTEANNKAESIPKEFPKINKSLSKNGIRYTFTSAPESMSFICEVEE